MARGRDLSVTQEVTPHEETTGQGHMIQLTVLGDVDLRTRDGVVAGSVLSQPRRLALLVYLAIESVGGGVQRDRLLGVFWPDLPQDQARQSLRTALHFLRRSLGGAVISSRGSAVALDPAAICCDATEFGAAMADGDAERALRLYRGDLLPAFYLDGGPAEFERWADEKRAELRLNAASAAWSLASQQEEEGNAPGAGAWARRAAHLLHGDEAAVRRCIELLGRIGDRAGALAAYQDLEQRLRDEFDAEPSPETCAAIARVRGEVDGQSEPGAARRASGSAPSRPANVEPAATAGAADPVADSAGASSPPSKLRRVGRVAYSAAVSVVLMIAFYSLWGLDRGDTSMRMSAAGPIIHVEDLRDFSADGGTADLAGALTLELTGLLSEADGLRIISLAGSPAPASEPHPATYVVRGGIMRSDSLVRVAAMLVDGISGATIDRVTTERVIEPSTVTSHATTEIAAALARRIRREVGRAVDDLERRESSTNSTALMLVRGAVRDMEAADSLRGARAPAAALVALAAADSQLAVAHSLTRRWAEPSVRRAEIAYRELWLLMVPPLNQPERAAEVLHVGLRHSAAALARRPDDPAAHELAGVLNYWLWRLRAAGSEIESKDALQRAEHHLQRATQLDGGQALAWSILGALLEARGEFAAANLAARRAFRADAYLENSSETLVRLFSTSLEVGDVSAARRWCEELSRPGLGAWLAEYCALELMAWHWTSKGVTIDSVHGLIESAIAASPGATPVHARIQMLGAVVLARAGSPAALPAMQAARELSAPDADLLALEAWAHLALGDEELAAALLERAMAADARGGQALLKSRRFAALRER